MYLGILDRFGYELTVIDTTEAKVRAAMLKEYKETYKAWNNGCKPDAEEIRSMKDDMNVYEMELGKVEWR